MINYTRAISASAIALLAFGALADTPPQADAAKAPIDSTTVIAPRDRATLENEVRSFVNTIVVKPGDESLARWQSQIPLCPLVAGLPASDGEYILSRVSTVARLVGAPLAPEHCKGNLVIVFTSDPEGVLKAWSKRDVRMFGEETDQGSTKVREFAAAAPIRVWYNAQFYQLDGTPLGTNEARAGTAGRATRLELNNYRILASVMALVDTRRMKSVSFGQVAAYVAMVGLVQLNTNTNVSAAPTILNVFHDDGKAPTSLTAWDEAFLKATYQARVTDRQQLAEIKTTMVEDVAR
jgi:hypothetical protein